MKCHTSDIEEKDRGRFITLSTEVGRDIYADLLNRAGRSLRVCIVAPGQALSDGSGEAARFASHLAMTLVADGHEVTLLLPNGLDREAESIVREQQFQQHQIAFAYPPVNDAGKIVGTPAQIQAYETYSWLKNHNFDLIHCFESPGLAYYALLAKHQGLCFGDTLFCLSVQGSTLWAKNGFSYPEGLEDLSIDFMERQSVSLADLAICPSQSMIDWLLANNWQLPTSTFVQQNPLSLSSARGGQSQQTPTTVVKDNRTGNRTKVAELVFFGSLEQRSGLALFCDAVDRLSAVLRFPVTITFFGKSSWIGQMNSRQYLLERSHNWAFSCQILDNFDDAQAMEYLLSGRRLAVIPCLQGHSSYAILNCLTAAVPFVCSRVDGLAELIDGKDLEAVTFEPFVDQLHSKLLTTIHQGVDPARPALDAQANTEVWQQWHRIIAQKLSEGSPRSVQSSQASWPLVTVCIPHFNRPDYLRQALHSIITQDYPQIEVIVVDDGSTDRAAQLALPEIERQLQKRGWSLLRQKHSSVGAARNLAARHARGEYLLFMDDDNYGKSHELSTMVRVALSTGAEIVTCFMDVFSGADAPCINQKPERCRVFLGAGASAGAFENVFGDTNALVSRQTFLKLGGYVEDSASAAEDWEFYAHAVLQGAHLEVVPEPLFWYRDTPNNRSSEISSFFSSQSVLRSYKRAIPAELGQLVSCAQSMFMQKNVFRNDRSSQHHRSNEPALKKSQADLQTLGSLALRSTRIITRQPIDDKLVSICLPVFNGEKFLQQALESVLKQSYENFELLIADDCSSDSSRAIIQDFALRDSRIKAWTNHSRLGLFANYNSCISRARGALIKPFAQDDYWAPDMLQKCVFMLESYPGVALVSTARNWIAQDNYLTASLNLPVADDYLIPDKPVAGYDVLRHSLLPAVNLIGEPSAVMFRSSCAGSGFDQRFRHLGDLDYWLRILSYGDYLFISEPLCNFRWHEASASRSNERDLGFLPDIFRLGVKFQWFLPCIGSDFGSFVVRAVKFASRHISYLLSEGRLSLPDLLDAEAVTVAEIGEDSSFRLAALLAVIAGHHEGPEEDAGMEPLYRRMRILEAQLRELLSSVSWRSTRVLREYKRYLGNSGKGENRPTLKRAENFDEKREYIRYLRRLIILVKRSRSWKVAAPLRAMAQVASTVNQLGTLKLLNRVDRNQAVMAGTESAIDARQKEVADRFSILLKARTKDPRCLAVLLCHNRGGLLKGTIEALLSQRHELVVYDIDSSDQTSDVLAQYAGSLLQCKRMQPGADQYQTYLAVSEHLRKEYVDKFDWISWPEHNQIFEGPRRELSYYDYARVVFNSAYDFVGFNQFIYYPTDEDDQTTASPVERWKRYCLWSKAPASIRAWRAQLTDARMFAQDPPSGECFPFRFNLRHYIERSGNSELPSVPAGMLHLDDDGELNPAEIFNWADRHPGCGVGQQSHYPSQAFQR